METDAARVAHHNKSIIVTSSGRHFIVARFVKSYVAYVIKPNKAPHNNAWTQEPFSIAGLIINITNPTMNNR